jgi:hypothetical protein
MPSRLKESLAMQGFSGFTGVFLLVLTTLTTGVQCLAQVTRANADDLMDVVFDMKKAAATADKLVPDGSKYCHWGIAPLDATDLDSAVSRFLLNHGSQVPDDISASKMWHVSFVADDLINQLEMRLQECNLGMRLNRGIYNVAVAGKPMLSKLQSAKLKFVGQAYLQTAWQEQNQTRLLLPGKPNSTDDGMVTPAVGVNEILGASLEVREAWESANKVATEAGTTKECLRYGPSDKRIEPVELNKLIDRVSRGSRSGSYIPAADMWLVAIAVDNQKLTTQFALEACGYYALWKKKAKKVTDAAFESDQRLKAALTKFDSLALRQTEWEEQVFQKQAIIKEN